MDDFIYLPTELEHNLVVNASENIHLVAHHTNATLEIDIFQDVIDFIIRTIRFYTWKHGLFVGRIQQDLVLETTKNILFEILLVVKNH